METTDVPQPDQAAAQKALAETRRVEDAVRHPATPYWFFALNAALMALLVLTQLLDSHATDAMAAVGLAVIVVNLLAARRAGVIGAVSATRGLSIALVATGAVILGSMLLYDITGQLWVVITAAAICAGLVLLGGWTYQRATSAE